MIRIHHALLIVGTTLGFSALSVLAGSLTPPAGAVSSTMKTLAEVEPRIAVNATNTPGDADSLYKIASPGSYYLTGNITGVSAKKGIEIAADGVTLDLMGFDVVGIAGALDGISVTAIVQNTVIRNGSVRSWPRYGVYAVFTENGRFEILTLNQNNFAGLQGGNASIIHDCTARLNNQEGIVTSNFSTVVNCVSSNNGEEGIVTSVGCSVSGCTVAANGNSGIVANTGCFVAHCTAQGNGNVGTPGGTRNGIQTSDACTVTDCTVYNNRDNGILTNWRCIVTKCVSSENNGDGIECAAECLVTENSCSDNGIVDGAGILVTNARTRVEGNLVTNNDRGIDVNAGGNIIIRNSASNNTINYDIVANNKVGTLLVPPNSGAISGNVGAAGLGTSDPWANFAF
jgi:parallel beta-helix repeat protein